MTGWHTAIKTTSKLVVCTDPGGVRTCWPLKGVLRVCHRITITGSRWKRLFSFAYFLLLPVNGSIYSLSVIWSLAKSSSSWFWIYSWIIFAFFPAVSTKYPWHQKFLLPYLYFRFACLSKIIRVLLLLSVPQTVLYSCTVGYSPEDGCGLDRPLPRWFLLSFLCTAFLWSRSHLPLLFCRSLSPVLWCEYHVVFAPVTGVCCVFYLIFHPV